jgi:DNA-directed RNA polymerase subunit RPC12/RpoP
MALRRVYCPNCGGKIHAKGGWPGGLTKSTGKQCQHCGIALTGKVKWPTNVAIPANDPNPSMFDVLRRYR